MGEFGNLIAGDARSAPLVQFRLLHSKYHLCSIGTRGLLLTTYVKFINLFPEIKTVIEDIFKTDSNLRSSDAELQQRACEYLALSRVATLDVLATVNFINTSCLTDSYIVFALKMESVSIWKFLRLGEISILT